MEIDEEIVQDDTDIDAVVVDSISQDEIEDTAPVSDSVDVGDITIIEIAKAIELDSLYFEPLDGSFAYSDGVATFNGTYTLTTNKAISTADGQLKLRIKGGNSVVVDADEDNNGIIIKLDRTILDQIAENSKNIGLNSAEITKLNNLLRNVYNKEEIGDLIKDFITNAVNNLINYYNKTETYSKSEVNTLVESIKTFSVKIVDELPETGEEKTIYFVPSEKAETGNAYNEYIYLNSKWELIGTTKIDLSDYYTKEQVNVLLAEYSKTETLGALAFKSKITDGEIDDNSISVSKIKDMTYVKDANLQALEGASQQVNFTMSNDEYKQVVEFDKRDFSQNSTVKDDAAKTNTMTVQLNRDIARTSESGNTIGVATDLTNNTVTVTLKNKSGEQISSQTADLPKQTGGTWGSIGGTLTDQTDLQNALDAKQDTISNYVYAIRNDIEDNARGFRFKQSNGIDKVIAFNVDDFDETVCGPIETQDKRIFSLKADVVRTGQENNFTVTPQINGSDIVNKTEIANFITKAVDDLTNYYKKSETYTQTEIDKKISAIPKFNIKVVETLPTTDISNTTVYLLKTTSSETGNLYDEYIYVDEKWEKLGSQTVDLTDYVTIEAIENGDIKAMYAEYANHAETADKATQDEDGNNIVNTYLTQSAGASLLGDNTFMGKQTFNGELEVNAGISVNSELKVTDSAIKSIDTASDTVATYQGDKIKIEQGGSASKTLTLPKADGTLLLDTDEKIMKTDTDQTVDGIKTFSNYIKTPQVASVEGKGLVRYKSVEKKSVYGNDSTGNVLMGNTDRPSYSKSGSDFNGNELALLSDLNNKIEASNIKAGANISVSTSGNDITINAVAEEASVIYIGGERASTVNFDSDPQTQITNNDTDISNLQSAKLDSSKADKNVVSGVTVSANDDNVNVVRAYVNLSTQVTSMDAETFPLANDTTAGLMSKADYSQIRDNKARIEQLEGQNIRLLYTASTAPTASQIEEFVKTAGYADTSKWIYIGVVVSGTNHIWRYYTNTTTWTDIGIDTVNQFTNSIAGIIKGSATAGKIYAETDGTGSVYGWDNLNTSVSNNASAISTETTNRQSAIATRADTSLSNIDSSGEQKIKDVTSAYTKTESDAKYVNLTDNQTIAGTKIFSDTVKCDNGFQSQYIKTYSMLTNNYDQTRYQKICTVSNVFRNRILSGSVATAASYSKGANQSGTIIFEFEFLNDQDVTGTATAMGNITSDVLPTFYLVKESEDWSWSLWWRAPLWSYATWSFSLDHEISLLLTNGSEYSETEPSADLTVTTQPLLTYLGSSASTGTGSTNQGYIDFRIANKTKLRFAYGYSTSTSVTFSTAFTTILWANTSDASNSDTQTQQTTLSSISTTGLTCKSSGSYPIRWEAWGIINL